MSPLLQVLCADVVRLNSFGAARGIKHLMLEVPKIDCAPLSSSLAVLKQLQTLWVSVGDMPERQKSHGALQLTALQALRTVALDGLVPSSIRLDDKCELHVSHCSGWSVERAVWHTVVPHLCSVVITDSNLKLMALPSTLFRADRLVKASLSVENLGTAAAPVQLHCALARVEELAIHCMDLHAIVPPNVAWRSINLTARNVLDLRFEAVLSFSETTPAFSFRYLSLQVPCPLASPIVCPSVLHLLLRFHSLILEPAGASTTGVGRCFGEEPSGMEGTLSRGWRRG